MIGGVRKLEELCFEKCKDFGNKANNLSCMMSWGVPVLPGFCITFNIDVEYKAQIAEYTDQIKANYRILLQSGKTKSVIVRSSADLEDSEKNLFPGVFQSIPSVTDLAGLFDAVRLCFESIKAPRVKHYARAKGIKCNFKYFTVIVQVELEPEYSGVASTHFPVSGYQQTGVMLAELTKGKNHHLLKGLETSNIYTFYEQNDTFFYRKTAGQLELQKGVETDILKQLYRLLNSLQQIFQHQLDIEWGLAEGILYVFQVRHLTVSSDRGQNDQVITAFAADSKQGLKYQAMHFFCMNGLFQKETLFFPAETPKEEIAKTLELHAEDTTFTIRYSRKREIGLPRFFASSRCEAIDFIIRTKESDWSVIVYKSLSVVDSYELYMDQDKIVLEHVPGLWESDSSLVADTIILERDKVRIWLADKMRMAKQETSSGIKLVPTEPLLLDDILPQLSDRLPTLEKVKKLFQNDLPINLHFISDGKQDYFLNCRLAPYVNWLYQYNGPVYIIQELSDCEGWDGKTSILFRPNLCRGEEIFLAEFVPFLKMADVPIIVEFGILSHPAIMLREFGITVIPQFLNHNFFEIPRFSIDGRRYNK